MRLFVLFFIVACFFYIETSLASPDSGEIFDNEIEPINDVFVEPFGCPAGSSKEDCGIRYKVRNVNISGEGNVVYLESGGLFHVTMEILHDCDFCGNAINQIIVGLSSDEKAQISVWNGKKRSGGVMKIVNPKTPVASFAEDNNIEAEWVKVYFVIDVPNKKGVYYLRTRYSQAYTGNVLTHENSHAEQEVAIEPLGWWKVDRLNGPSSKSNIGAFIVR
ncbi:MAG: hypothetical protein PQ612_07475 [Rickettsiales bacterium]|nr:hypothetical protein [Pseudomonadota bacterium]MDA0966927.1 hypothetical protein [Pseudomonadota bacterium]MDG4543846.1 hypothetical protein [Rickettsiales bacterium]MDG4545992.1 hypothetical protein [Rickettsiales bacterium]MDG4548238.1 hypothetical protein [Rickettsiales bacterium]